MTGPEADPELSPPTAEELEARRVRTGKSTKRALAAVLILEALVVLLVPRAIARTGTGLDSTKTVLLIAFAVVLVVAGAMLRRAWGIGLGSVLQLVVLATGFWTSAMFVLGVVFIAVWLYTLNLRRELVGTPGGWRMLVS